MKGILRAAGLFYTWVPLQRWLAVIGLTLIVLGHVRYLAVPAARGFWPILALVLGLGFILTPAVLVGGLMFRAISAPRTLRLIPYARLQLLLALLLAALALAAFFTANIALVEIEAPTAALARAQLLSVFVGVLGGETLLMLWFFVVSYSPYAALSIYALILAERPLASLIKSSAAHTSIMGATYLGALLIVGAWSAFSFWYLRVRRIAPPIWGDATSVGTGFNAKREARVSISRESAMVVQLLGLSSVARLAWQGFLGMTTIVIALALTTSRRADGTLATNAAGAFLFIAVLCTSITSMGIAWGIAGRSRLLWIQSGYSREELFRWCERLSWRCAAVIGAPTLALCVAVWIFLPHAATDWQYFLAATLAPAVCALYLGLMNVQGWRVVDISIAVLIVLIGMGSVIVPATSVATVPLPIVIPMAEFLGSLVLREMARRRWRRIDWLICKPVRTSSQALRPVA